MLKRISSTSKPSDSQEEALPRALRFLGYRPRSEAELRNFLVQRGFSTAITERTLEKLCSLNYLNDEAFARNWARSRAETRGYGPKRIEQELKTKGIGQALIREVMRETFGQVDESARANSLLEKRFKSKQFDDPKMVRRAVGFLQRRGYSSKVIFDLLKYPLEDD
ncbi:MAG TPA: regulatory protein RecX [Candidatus Binatia bacterium]|nr:regulatory protein RecX [Candidatus Binatia bacterium]